MVSHTGVDSPLIMLADQSPPAVRTVQNKQTLNAHNRAVHRIIPLLSLLQSKAHKRTQLQQPSKADAVQERVSGFGNA